MRYHDLYKSGELLQRVRVAYERLASCDLCPRECRVNRIKGDAGACRSGLRPKIASANVHHGEEPPVSGTRGSGTIFLSNCNLQCIFCQNFPISQLGNGEEISTSELAARMLKLQRQGVHNINFVTPGHMVPQILAALYLAVRQDFQLPIVWNSNGYDKVDVLQLLDGIVEVYLPDMKYADDVIAEELSRAVDYCRINRSAVGEMLRQSGHLQLDSEGVAIRGLIIRHLVLPGGRAGSAETLRWIAKELGTSTHISLMKQYFPAYRAAATDGMGRKITDREYDEAVDVLEACYLENGWVQS
jgi:putative pyruvate formate lyase activating enzyme